MRITVSKLGQLLFFTFIFSITTINKSAYEKIYDRTASYLSHNIKIKHSQKHLLTRHRQV